MTLSQYFNRRSFSLMASLKWFALVAMAFSIIFFFSGILDVILISISQNVEDVNYLTLAKSLGLEILLSFSLAGLWLLPFMVIAFFSRITAKLISLFIFTLSLLLNVLLIYYYYKTSVPLDQVIFMYSYKSIISVINISGGISFLGIASVVFVIFLFLALVYLLISKVQLSRISALIFGLILIASAATTNVYIVSPNAFKSEQQYYNNANKLIYFVKAVLHYRADYNETDITNIRALNAKWQQKEVTPKTYVNTIYPFLYIDDNSSTLAPFFNALPKGEKPDVVFVVVESLSNTLSGKYSPNHSFTPFFDSLAEQSLYWHNALSSSERTFGVLPTVLASLPPGKTGFMAYYKHYPHFYSLPLMLKANGYRTQMFYGGWIGFTHMDSFVHTCGIDSIYNNFVGYKKMPPVKDDFTWGYGDDVLFRASFPYVDNKKPYFSLYLTLSTHSPFSVNNQQQYIDKVDEALSDIKEGTYPYKYTLTHKKQLSTFFMFDNELRNFFREYKKRPEYNKTIFVITGDHKSALFYATNNLDKYHVPLVIFSPLLKKAQEFKGVVSHFDIMPSMVNLLEEKYGLKGSLYNEALGHELDTSTVFHSTQRLFFMRNNRNVDEYLYNDIVVAGNRLYRLHDSIKMEPIDNEQIKNKMQKEIKEYMHLQKRAVKSNTLFLPQKETGFLKKRK